MKDIVIEVDYPKTGNSKTVKITVHTCNQLGEKFYDELLELVHRYDIAK